uniref:Uncharacterized protein n=1 Tax=Globodera rostochiensis TaxID=31243 RepID=A0A914I6J1_GLORO
MKQAKKEIEQAEKEIEDAKKEIEQAEKLMEVKKRKAKEEDDEKTGEPPIKMFKHGHADEHDDVVEDEQSEITKSDEDDGVENFLDALQGFDRTAGRDKNGLCLTCEF